MDTRICRNLKNQNNTEFCHLQCNSYKEMNSKKKVNTPYNNTQMNKAMLFSQSVRTRQCVYLNR